MNATETIFALALASNLEPEVHFSHAYQVLENLGGIQFSQIYLIPCRDGVGADYWNSACILKSHLSVEYMLQLTKNLEVQSGRIRPSHKISLDVDLIAWGKNLNSMQFNPKKLPLALDVKLPLSELWQHELLHCQKMNYPIVQFTVC